MTRSACVLSVFLIACCVGAANAQKQLVLLKNQTVRLRLHPGDEIVFRLKGSKRVRKSYVNNLYDTAVVAHEDVIPFHKIERLYFKHSNFRNTLGTLFVIGGAGFFLIDQFNATVVEGDEPNLDDNVTKTSLGLLAVGLPMMLIHKNSQRIGGKYRLLVVEKGSPFYAPPITPMEGVFSD